MADDAGVQEGSDGFAGLCRAIDADPDLAGAAVSYVDAEGAVPIRGSDLVIETHVVLTPQGEAAPSSTEFTKAMIDVGFDCGLATMSALSAAAACGGTVVTLGTAAPLCVLATVGTTTGAWSCGASIGKAVNAWQDPRLNEILEREGTPYKRFNDMVETVDKVSAVVSAGVSARQLVALRKITAAHAGKIGTAYTKKESNRATKEFLDATYEVYTLENVLSGINRMGSAMRMSSKPMTGRIADGLRQGMSGLRQGMSIQATKRYINARGLQTPFSPDAQRRALLKDMLWTGAGVAKKPATETLKVRLDQGQAQGAVPQPPVMHIFQRAQPLPR